MTITMAKRGVFRPAQAPFALLALLLAPNCLADWRFTPTVDLKETYTDNVALARDGLARSELVSEITPGFLLRNESPRLKVSANYQLHYFLYGQRDQDDTQRSQSTLASNLRATLVDDLMFLDGTGSVNQAAVSAFGPQASSTNLYTRSNRASVKSWRLSPYMKKAFGAAMTGELRYAHDYVDAGDSGLGRSNSDNLTLALVSGPAFHKLGWNASVMHQTMKTAHAANSTVDNVNTGLRYVLNQEWNLTAGAGYDSYDYDSVGGKTGGASYTGGFAWTPSSRTSLTASAGRRYYGSSYLLSAMHRSRHTVWRVNYNDAVTTTRSNFLLPSTVNTADMLDKLFAAQISDPVARAAAVRAYIAMTGLPPALADNVNYFSNRYFLQKQFQASVAFNSARTVTVLTLADTRRNGLSAIQTDSALLGPDNINLNDDTHQKSASATWSWKLAARTTALASATATRTESLSSHITTSNRALRLGLTHQFKARLQGAAELRRMSGTSADFVHNYRENAITASLNMQL